MTRANQMASTSALIASRSRSIHGSPHNPNDNLKTDAGEGYPNFYL